MVFSDDGNFLAIFFGRFNLLQIYERGADGSIETLLDKVENNDAALSYILPDEKMMFNPNLKFDKESKWFVLYKGRDVIFANLTEKDNEGKYNIFRSPFKLSRKYSSILDL